MTQHAKRVHVCVCYVSECVFVFVCVRVHAGTCVSCVYSRGLRFAYGRATEERVSSWLVID